VTLNRPELLNAIDGSMIDAALDVFARLSADDGVRAVVVTGAGRGFCAGGDLRAIDADAEDRNSASEVQAVAAARRPMAIVELLRTMPKPVIAAVNGACAGAGMAWACACDFRLAGRSAFFTTAYLDAGLAGDYGITWTLPRIVGVGRATELLLAGVRLTADDAAGIGLVSRVLDDGELLPAAIELARRFENRSASAVADLKANLLESQTLTFAGAIDAETERLIRALRAPGATTAALSVLNPRVGERRPPGC
jgi:2-(1,2-epoxy-1,2-dihydrophenyl)acetyl-CoA isomerase